MNKFPTAADFKSETQADVAWKWRELARGVYKIKSRHPAVSRFGPGMCLGLEDIDGGEFLAWAPARLVEKLNEDPTIRFVLNDGLKKSQKDPSKQYFAFSTLS